MTGRNGNNIRICFTSALLGFAGIAAVAWLLVAKRAHADDHTLHYFPCGSIYEYRWDLLQLALSHEAAPGQPVHLMPALDTESQDRAVKLVMQGTIDVVSFGYSAERAKDLLPVRIDTLKGIVGFREFIVRESDEARLSAMNAKEFHDKLTFGLNSQWADLPIMTDAGFHVVSSLGYENLFTMLAAGRFDAFPRGLNEIDRDIDLRNEQTPALVIEHRHAIYFPYPVYFWVRKDNTALAERIRKGLEASLADGSMRQLFLRYHAFEIGQLQGEHRDIIRLPNKRLPDASYDPDTSWWWPQSTAGEGKPKSGARD